MSNEAQATVCVEVWLYGPLARYGGKKSQGSHAILKLRLPTGTRMADLLGRLRIPRDEKGITFINAQLTDMPGLSADLDWVFQDGDRVGIFHRQSMWPFQYRHGVSLSESLSERMKQRKDGGFSHSPASAQNPDTSGS
ncbi:MAG TPA: MoaD/ThiS family protein [Chloroflexota bacterium]